ncbi:MAG: aldehyde ferredoxin oxidoreductase C-terminal domain-containing protein [Candidatus Bathyarchaeota archaeon]|jgi:aldehyde:ferredoxin oxidoreductase
MPGGYAGKFLDIDLTKEKIKETTFSDEILEQYFGGRGLAAKILWDRIGKDWPKVDPLGPENIFIALTGPMTAIYPGARICCSGKSPVSNGTVGSTASTEFASELKAAGYDGVIVSGEASDPVYILVTDEGGEIRGADHLWGKVSEETIKILNKEVTEGLTKRNKGVGLFREPGKIYIGPAGENMVRNSAVCTKVCHAAGYGGYGAVMGSKNLKAIVAKGRGMLPEVDAPEAVKLMLKKTEEHLIKPRSMRRWGTGYAGFIVGNVTSSEPIRNWQEEWHDAESFGGPRFENRYWVKKYWADFGCSTSCMKVSCIKSGRWKGDITDMPDYELEAYCGTNLGIFDPGDNIHISTVVDKLGHSGINGPNTMGFAAELYQRGILTEEEIGLKLEWGDTEAFDKLAHMIAYREGIGDILAEGTYRAALKLGEMKGMDLLKYAVHVKGIEIGAHGTRSDEDYTHDISYAPSVQGGDHTSVAVDGYSELSAAVFTDSAVVCNFCFYGVPQELVFDFAKGVTGFPITRERWRTVNGPRIVTLQRALLLMGGPDIFWEPLEDDENPPRFYQPLPSGPYKGRTTDRKLVEEKRAAYFETLGWDDRGIPEKETLEKLDLADLETPMKALRK